MGMFGTPCKTFAQSHFDEQGFIIGYKKMFKRQGEHWKKEII